MIDGRRATRDAEATTQSSDAAAEHWYRRVRLGERLASHGVTANMVTLTGVVLSGATAVLIGLGKFHVALVIYIVAGLMDSLDGAVAKARGDASRQGAFLDSVADRLSDGLLLGGVAWYLAAGAHPRDALLALVVLIVSSLVSYERAKAESLGLNAKGGLMERAERMILLALGIFLPFLLVPVLWALAVLTSGTAIGRFVRVWRQAGGAASAPRLGDAIWRTGRVESRWRAWREQGALAGPGATFGPWQGRRREPRATRLREERRLSAASRRAARTTPGRERAARALMRRLHDTR
jgi:CDP-diacylglycerol--glycerol-3-phosphate 3-phosphatidyltransferase